MIKDGKCQPISKSQTNNTLTHTHTQNDRGKKVKALQKMLSERAQTEKKETGEEEDELNATVQIHDLQTRLVVIFLSSNITACSLLHYLFYS